MTDKEDVRAYRRRIEPKLYIPRYPKAQKSAAGDDASHRTWTLKRNARSISRSKEPERELEKSNDIENGEGNDEKLTRENTEDQRKSEYFMTTKPVDPKLDPVTRLTDSPGSPSTPRNNAPWSYAIELADDEVKGVSSPRIVLNVRMIDGEEEWGRKVIEKKQRRDAEEERLYYAKKERKSKLKEISRLREDGHEDAAMNLEEEVAADEKKSAKLNEIARLWEEENEEEALRLEREMTAEEEEKERLGREKDEEERRRVEEEREVEEQRLCEVEERLRLEQDREEEERRCREEEEEQLRLKVEEEQIRRGEEEETLRLEKEAEEDCIREEEAAEERRRQEGIVKRLRLEQETEEQKLREEEEQLRMEEGKKQLEERNREEEKERLRFESEEANRKRKEEGKRLRLEAEEAGKKRKEEEEEERKRQEMEEELLKLERERKEEEQREKEEDERRLKEESERFRLEAEETEREKKEEEARAERERADEEKQRVLERENEEVDRKEEAEENEERSQVQHIMEGAEMRRSNDSQRSTSIIDDNDTEVEGEKREAEEKTEDNPSQDGLRLRKLASVKQNMQRYTPKFSRPTAQEFSQHKEGAADESLKKLKEEKNPKEASEDANEDKDEEIVEIEKVSKTPSHKMAEARTRRFADKKKEIKPYVSRFARPDEATQKDAVSAAPTETKEGSELNLHHFRGFRKANSDGSLRLVQERKVDSDGEDGYLSQFSGPVSPKSPRSPLVSLPLPFRGGSSANSPRRHSGSPRGEVGPITGLSPRRTGSPRGVPKDRSSDPKTLSIRSKGKGDDGHDISPHSSPTSSRTHSRTSSNGSEGSDRSDRTGSSSSRYHSDEIDAATLSAKAAEFMDDNEAKEKIALLEAALQSLRAELSATEALRISEQRPNAEQIALLKASNNHLQNLAQSAAQARELSLKDAKVTASNGDGNVVNGELGNDEYEKDMGIVRAELHRLQVRERVLVSTQNELVGTATSTLKYA